MKRTLRILSLTLAFAIVGFGGFAKPDPLTVQGANVTVKLVLGKGANLSGYTATDDATIFHENVVTYTAASGSPMPTPSKTGTEFVSWVHAENGALVRVAVMPLTSGAVYFAYWNGDGTLATEDGGSSSETGPNIDLYLNTGGSLLWNKDGARFYVYTFNAATTGAWPGLNMTLVTGDIYYASVPSGFTGLNFARINPSDGSTWNQTGDLTFSSSFNLYTITGWGGTDGYWSSYS